MFIDVASTAPLLDLQRCPKQLILRVAHVESIIAPYCIEGIAYAIDGEVFKPIVEAGGQDRVIGRPIKWREYSIQPKLFPGAEVDFDFAAQSAVLGVQGRRTPMRLSLNYDGKEWALGIMHLDPENGGVMLWLPLPDYDPICKDLTPLQQEIEDAKPKEPSSDKKRKNAWERIKDD